MNSPIQISMNYKHIMYRVSFNYMYNSESIINVKIFNSLSFRKNYMRTFLYILNCKQKLKDLYTKNSNIKLIVKIFP